MSILDGLPSSQEELVFQSQVTAFMNDQLMEQLGLKDNEVIKLMKEGLSPADIHGITKEQRDALLAVGLRFVQVNAVKKARDVLIPLYLMEPLDARVIYAIGATYQVEGDFATAAKLYIQFLALDATNPEGYLRLGECLLAAREFSEAKSSFKAARRFAAQAKDAEALAHADKMLSLTEERTTETE